MKNLITLIITLFSFALFGQQLTIEEWNIEAKTNKRLLPRYGNKTKTEQEKIADQEFIKTILTTDTTLEKGSNHMIDLGFQYLYRDIKTAMYRFNQAYLLDSTNSDIYWGFGAIYMTLGDYQSAKKQYLIGLKSDPLNNHLLTDYGTYFMAQYYGLMQLDEKAANLNLDSAIYFMLKSFEIDKTDQNTLFKLSILYWNKNECESAWKYYNECMKLGGAPITDAYTNDLKMKCKPENIDCSGLEIGKFKIEDSKNGLTIIERTKKYQIEENVKLGYKLKLEIKWIDECTYELTPIKNLLNPDGELPKMILTCVVLESDEKSYLQVSSAPNMPKLTSRLIRIE